MCRVEGKSVVQIRDTAHTKGVGIVIVIVLGSVERAAIQLAVVIVAACRLIVA